ncbi:GrpE-like protein [Drosera capensis]
MATLLRCPTFRTPPTLPSLTASSSFKPLKAGPIAVNFSKRASRLSLTMMSRRRCGFGVREMMFVARGASGEVTETEEEVKEVVEVEENANGGVDVGSVDGSPTVEEKVDGSSASPILTSLQQYKEAIRNKDDSIIAEIEAFFLSIVSEKNTLEKKVVSLSEELLVAKDRILRISADFDNFRKRTDKERLSLVSNAQGEVIENLLPVLDNFERAKAQIKLETEGEEKINNSYQSIYKQFTESLTAIGVVPVETIGKPFDPLLHEAIMQEDSTEFVEGVIIEEYRKGFKLGDRLLRPAMVKVSAGPGPSSPEVSETSAGADDGTEDAPENATEDDFEEQAAP